MKSSIFCCKKSDRWLDKIRKTIFEINHQQLSVQHIKISLKRWSNGTFHHTTKADEIRKIIQTTDSLCFCVTCLKNLFYESVHIFIVRFNFIRKFTIFFKLKKSKNFMPQARIELASSRPQRDIRPLNYWGYIILINHFRISILRTQDATLVDLKRVSESVTDEVVNTVYLLIKIFRSSDVIRTHAPEAAIRCSSIWATLLRQLRRITNCQNFKTLFQYLEICWVWFTISFNFHTIMFHWYFVVQHK